MIVISLPASLGIGKELSSILGLKHLDVVYKLFPDNESYIRFPAHVGGEDVILVQTTYPNQDKRLTELLLAIDAAVSQGARSVSAVVPYLAYARQDRVFIEGEAVSIRALLRALKRAGLNRIYVIDIHKEGSLTYFGGEAYNIDPAPLFAEVLKNELHNPLVVAPDLGAKRRARSLASLLRADYTVIEKQRDRITGEVTHKLPEDLNVNNRDVVIIDDIISTGGTIAGIAKYLRSLGARRIVVTASHGLFVGNAISRLEASGVNEVYVLKTVEKILSSNNIKVLDPASLIAGKLHETLPISSD